MTSRILLYGATGYSGRLIAAEVQQGGRSGPLGDSDVVLGGRDRIALEAMTDELGLNHVVFALDDRSHVVAALSGFDVVINAAGPFAQTGKRLVKAAISAGVHYVDINGEVDVYKTLDDLGRIAAERGVTIVSGAGFTATVSDVMLDSALRRISSAGIRELHAVRIVTSAIQLLSRGSLHTMLRSVREQVTVLRAGKVAHVPVGVLERMFDFGADPEREHLLGRSVVRRPQTSQRIASAVNTIDTLTAGCTVRRYKTKVDSIESYVEMPASVRLTYQLGALSTVMLQLPWVRRFNQLQIDQLPEGPDEQDRQRTRHTVLLQIETSLRERLVDWRLTTPDSYDFTARSALAVAAAVARTPGRGGWKTPAEMLGSVDLMLPTKAYPFQNCTLETRTGHLMSGTATV